MKRLVLCIVFILCMLAGTVVCYGDGNFTMTAVKADREYEWDEGYRMQGFDKATGKPVVFSAYENGYFYSYAPENLQVEFRPMEEGVSYNDISGHQIPSGLQKLTWSGVFQGDSDGNFCGSRTLTRAQMAVLMARVLDAEEETIGDMPYSDVPRDSWYASSVFALMKRGIVAQDSRFSPDRPVTRQELVTMEYRIVRELGGQMKERTPFDKRVKDVNSVAEYAEEAYEYLNGSGYDVPSDILKDNVIDNSKIEIGLLPANPVTRLDAAAYLESFIQDFMRTNVPAIPSESAVRYGFDQEMPRISGSTSSYPITSNIYWSLFENYRNHPSYPESHAKTVESYKMLIDGETDVILVPDPGSEVKALVQERNVKLEYIPIAKEALVFFTSKYNRAENLSSSDIGKIYAENSVKNWNELGGPDAPFAAFCRNNDSGSHAQMERFFLKGREIHPDIRRERTSISMSNVLTDVEDYNREHSGSYALGYSMYYYYLTYGTLLGAVDDLKLLTVDGVMPSEESLSDGSYPLTTNYFAVIREDEPEDSSARRLTEYLVSGEGQAVIVSAGFGAL